MGEGSREFVILSKDFSFRELRLGVPSNLTFFCDHVELLNEDMEFGNFTSVSTFYFEEGAFPWKLLSFVGVNIVFVFDTALNLTANSVYFAWDKGQILILGHFDRRRLLVLLTKVASRLNLNSGRVE